MTADVLGRRFYDAVRLAAPAAVAVPGVGNVLSVQPVVGSFNTVDLSLGVKAQTRGHFLVTGNVTLKLNNGGLRARAVPLGGVSYSFQAFPWTAILCAAPSTLSSARSRLPGLRPGLVRNGPLALKREANLQVKKTSKQTPHNHAWP